MGANAESDRYCAELRSAQTSAPCPPIEWPKIPQREVSAGKCPEMTAGSSCVT